MTQQQMDSNSLIGAFRDAGLIIKGIACVVILTFGGLVTSPAVAAVKQEVQKIQWTKPDNKAAALSKTLKDVHRLLDNLPLNAPTQVPTTATTNAATAPATFTAKQTDAFKAAREQLKVYHDQLKTLDQDTLAQFASVKAHLLKRHLPQVILNREAKAEATYKTRMSTLMAELNAANASTDNATFQRHVLKMKAQLDEQMKERPKTHFDPNNLPNRSLKPNLNRKPFTTKKQFAEAGFISNPYIQVASLTNNFDISHMPSAQDPAYLAATTEVTLSPAIKAKAAALNYNPVEIYNWVRNNVVWQPTWGAVQDADLTLSAQRGNAFDISSLLIALLRASGIPARYVQGTINVPEAKFRNWMGGFQNINSAIEYASSGGIPITGLISGGKITTVQMEHIWVEAAVDYFPSRGVKNKSANTWVPMDASFKQYIYKKGLDPLAISGLNIGTLSQQYLNESQINPDGGVSNLDPSILNNAQQFAETALQGYITQNIPNASVTDILGGSEIIDRNSSTLSASLSNSIVAIGVRYGVLPAQLEQSITFSIGTDATGSPLNPVTLPWPALNNQQVVLSFIPATNVDLQTLESLLPSGQITDIGQLPTSIPAYLVNVIPQLNVNGQVVVTGATMTLGQDTIFHFTPNFAGRGSIEHTYNVTAGSYLGVAVIAGNVSIQKLQELQSEISSTEAILAAKNVAVIQGLTRQHLLGDMFDVGLLGYYSQYMDISEAIGLGQGGHHYLAAGLGSFGFEPTVKYLFGLPQSIVGGGVVMNMPIVNVNGFDGTSTAAKKYYAIQVGTLSSALENSVPEHMFRTSDETVSAISAVKALELANAAGQKIYLVTQSNESTVLPLIHANSQALQEISDAISSGDEVVTHTDPVAVPGWSGTGYIILDPTTGDGAYKISGGQNGSWLLLGLVIIGIMMILAALPIFLEAGATFLALSSVSSWEFVYIAFQEFLYFLDALKFASLNNTIAVSNCSEAEKAQLSQDLTTYLLLQLVTVSMGTWFVTNADNEISAFFGELISFTGNAGGYKVMDTVVDSSIENQIEACH